MLEELRADYPMLMDITAVDYGVEASPRFEVIYHLFNPASHEYLRVASLCAPGQTPMAPSVADLWPGANWHEREAYDLMGIVFDGHPNLNRILLWEGYPYHPLRKDFPLAGFDTEFPGEDVAEETGAKVAPAPMVGGPFVATEGRSMQRREPAAKDESWHDEKEAHK